MKVSDMPDDATLVTNSQEIDPILEELHQPKGSYGALFVLITGEVYGIEGAVAYLDRDVEYLGRIEG